MPFCQHGGGAAIKKFIAREREREEEKEREEGRKGRELRLKAPSLSLPSLYFLFSFSLFRWIARGGRPEREKLLVISNPSRLLRLLVDLFIAGEGKKGGRRRKGGRKEEEVEVEVDERVCKQKNAPS